MPTSCTTKNKNIKINPELLSIKKYKNYMYIIKLLALLTSIFI